MNQLQKIKSIVESVEQNAKQGKTSETLAEKFKEKLAIKVGTFLIRKNEEDTEKEMLALIDRAIDLKRGFKLRDTQKLAILALLTNDRNTLAQVSTGEGKSLIVVAAAIMKALRGEKVDIITSSSVLAKRDAEENKDIYELFRIKVSHNCSEDIEERKRAYSGNQVIYGELSNFQRDYLLDKFYGKNVLGDRNFVNVIVDEVDSMLLDRGNNMLYLSHDLAYLDKLESVYIFIWQWIKQPALEKEEISQIFNVEAIEKAVLSDLYGLVNKEEFENLWFEFNEHQINNIWTRLVGAKILDDQGKLMIDTLDDDEFNKIMSPEFCSYKDRLKYLLTEVIERERHIHVPNHLRPFVERHLKSWIKNAITAFCLKPGQDYVVDVDRTGTSSDRNPNIIILDRDTGTDQANSQWDDALHQFLQLKHGCRLSLQSLKAVFISNVSYFKLYQKLYGLTGTLGSQSERELLKEIHEVDFVTVPTFKSKQFDEYEPIICNDKDAWINQIQSEAKKLTEKSKRSVLIICDTVNDVEVLYRAFGGRDAWNVHMYKRDYEEFDIAQGSKQLEQGQIIIATNLAGRGTDIKPTDGLRKAGGLHVCLTYLPANIRIEQQAFGRAARSGDQGSGQLLIMDSEGQQYSSSRIIDLKKARDGEELLRISDVRVYYETQITMEEECFQVFKKEYENLEKRLGIRMVPTEIKDILMKSCLDKWAFWLNANTKNLGTLKSEQRVKCINSIKGIIPHLGCLDNTNSLLPWIEGNPAQMIKLGKYLSQNGQQKNAHENATALFDQVIEKEPAFSEAAHYYKAFALLQKIEREQRTSGKANQKTLEEVREELQKAARLFSKHSEFSSISAAIINNIKKRSTDNIIQINAFEEQQKSIASVYSMFARSIDDILGHAINPQSFVSADLDQDLAEIVYQDLLNNNVIRNLQVKRGILEKDLKTISLGYGLSPDPLREFLSEYRGKEIVPKEFLKALKTEVPLPSREAFWKCLIDGKVLRKEIKYVVVDSDKLRNFCPCLLHSLIRLESETLELKDGQIFLNDEHVSRQQSNDNVFIKEDFLESVGKEKYKLLKEKGILSFNRKARFDHNQLKAFNFPCYDFITVEDFVKVEIPKNEAQQILAKLTEENVIEKKANNSYKLKIYFDEIEEFSFSPYKNAVRALFSICFAFRIELQEIEKRLKERDFPIRLQLRTKPHQDLYWELYNRNIITNPSMLPEEIDLEERLKKIYSKTMNKKDFKFMLSQSQLIGKECPERIYHRLIEKKWITEFNPEHRFQSASGGRQEEQDIFTICEINSPDQRQTNGQTLFKMQIIDEDVKQILDRRLTLSNPDTIKNIVSTLNKSKSVLNASTVPDFQLKTLAEVNGKTNFANIEELHVFSLNGLGHLIQLAEEKWTLKMLCSTALVAIMGIAQIAIGLIILFGSVGIKSDLGFALIYEGFRDLHYAAVALRSGYFSWNDYTQFKIQRLLQIAATAGLGANFSRYSNNLGFGHRLAGPSYLISSKRMINMSPNEELNTSDQTLTNRCNQQVAEGVAFALNSAGTDQLIENSLQTLSSGVSSNILSHIAQAVDTHNISKTLSTAYCKLGEERARKLIDLTKSFLTEISWGPRLFPIAYHINENVLQGIANIVGNESQSNNISELSSKIINLPTVWSERVNHLANIKSMTGELLNNLDKTINEKLDGQQSNVASLGSNIARGKETKEEITNQWKKLLCDEAKQVISKRIVSPILSQGANLLIKQAEKKSRKVFQSQQDPRYLEQFDDRKQEYHEQYMKTKDQN